MEEENVIQMEAEGKMEKKEPIIFAAPKGALRGFIEFMQERGVASFAIGFIFGGAAQKLVQALMEDLVNPLVGLFLGNVDNLSAWQIHNFKVGDFISVFINFLVLCLVMYLIFRVLHLEKLDKPKK